MSRTRVVGAILLVAVGLMVLTACAAGPNEAVGSGRDAAGFWLGLWQGFITPVTFVISLFNDDVSVYEVNNTGNWYDFGFVLGVAAIFSAGPGGAAARSRR